MIKHTDDQNKNMKHPFLYLGNYKHKGLFVQFSSVKYHDNGEIDGSYFDGQPISDIIDVDIDDGLNFHSQASLNSLYFFNLKNNSDIFQNGLEQINECSNAAYEKVLNKLINNTYKKEWINELINYEYNRYFDLLS